MFIVRPFNDMYCIIDYHTINIQYYLVMCIYDYQTTPCAFQRIDNTSAGHFSKWLTFDCTFVLSHGIRNDRSQRISNGSIHTTYQDICSSGLTKDIHGSHNWTQYGNTDGCFVLGWVLELEGRNEQACIHIYIPPQYADGPVQFTAGCHVSIYSIYNI